VGDWVLAVGNPFGLGHTVTAGIISARRSAITIEGVTFRGMIQTDAPINKGSSGGPLVNLRGEVIGINSAIFSPSGVFNGTGFAIPSNRVGAFVAKATGSPNLAPPPVIPLEPMPARALESMWLGIGVVDMTPELASKLSFPYAGGVYVRSLMLDTPADEAEITRGDIITAMAGYPIADSASLRQIVSQLMPEQMTPITIWRGGKNENLMIRTRLGQPPGL